MSQFLEKSSLVPQDDPEVPMFLSTRQVSPCLVHAAYTEPGIKLRTSCMGDDHSAN